MDAKPQLLSFEFLLFIFGIHIIFIYFRRFGLASGIILLRLLSDLIKHVQYSVD